MRSLAVILFLFLPTLVSAAWHWDEDASHHVLIGDDPALTLPDGNFSMGGWIKLDDNNGDGYQYFIDWNFGNLPRTEWLFGEDGVGLNDGEFLIRVRDAGDDEAECVTTGSPAESTEWQHIMLIRRGAGVFTFYVNGVQDGTETDDTVDAVDAAANVYFGRRSDGAADRAFGGSMAEWAKWDRALDAGEHYALVAGFSPRLMPLELKWYMPMVRDYQELMVPLVLTNVGSTVSNHPSCLP